MNNTVKKISSTVKAHLPLSLKKYILMKFKNRKNPYTKYDDKNKCIFIHIPKNAGKSISKALFDANIGHRKIIVFEIFNKNKFEKYFKFTFVRNPWDRFVSAYTFLKEGGNNEQDRKWAKKHLSEFENFEEFVLALKDKRFRKKVISEQHFLPQYKYVCDFDMDIKVDFIGRVETIQEDFDFIAEKLGINATLPHINKTDHEEYVKYYTEETRKIVKELYEDDINLFNYDFRDFSEIKKF